MELTECCAVRARVRCAPYPGRMTDKEHCTLCGSEVEYHWVNAASYDDPTAREYVPWRCSQRACPNSNPANHTFGWSV